MVKVAANPRKYTEEYNEKYIQEMILQLLKWIKIDTRYSKSMKAYSQVKIAEERLGVFPTRISNFSIYQDTLDCPHICEI